MGFNYAAVAATDALTIAAHGLVTGDGPGRAIVAGGSLGGLTSSSDVWVIRIDANTIKLATSSANALLGTAINITADHSGYLGIGLPFTRARTYVAKAVSVAGSQVKSADLNSLQDDIINHRRGSVPLVLPADAFIKLTGAATYTGNQWVGVGTFRAVLPFEPGTLINWIDWGYNRGGAGAVSLSLRLVLPVNGAFSSTAPYSVTVAAGTGYTTTSKSGADIIAGGGVPLLAANSAWILEIGHTDAANILGGALIQTSKE